MCFTRTVCTLQHSGLLQIKRVVRPCCGFVAAVKHDCFAPLHLLLSSDVACGCSKLLYKYHACLPAALLHCCQGWPFQQGYVKDVVLVLLLLTRIICVAMPACNAAILPGVATSAWMCQQT
jgi:hypothetical protein